MNPAAVFAAGEEEASKVVRKRIIEESCERFFNGEKLGKKHFLH